MKKIDPSSILKSLTLFTFAAASSAFLISCEEKGPLEKAGEDMDDAVEEAGDAVEDATD